MKRLTKNSRLLFLTMGMTFMSLSSASYAQSAFPFLAPEFKVPEKLEMERFRLRTLTVNDVVKDYDAVMSSKEHLHDIWGPGWPPSPSRHWSSSTVCGSRWSGCVSGSPSC